MVRLPPHSSTTVSTSREGDGHRGQRDASFYLRPARQRAHQADGEHGGERKVHYLRLRLSASDGYQLPRPSGEQREVLHNRVNKK